MKKIISILAASLIAFCATAQDYRIPVTNINQNGYPHILKDNSVEFKFKAGNAQDVKIDIGGKRYDLTKDSEGFWTGKTDPQVPGYHYYSLIIDGASVADPASRSFYGTSRWASAIEIPEEGTEDFELQDVPHGQVRLVNYFSKQTNSWRPCLVYTPASYEKGNKKYPVVYIHHGGGEDYRGWIEQGHTAALMDNLIAQGRATEMIVVSVDSNVPAQRSNTGDSNAAYRNELINNIIPFIESTFRTKKGPKNRAMCGLSMGGGLSFNIGLTEPDVFANVALFSSGMFGGVNGSANVDFEKLVPGMISRPNRFNKGLDVFFITVGEQDPRFNYTREAVGKMRNAGVNVKYNSFPGDHEWHVWRKSFREFAEMIFK